MNNPEHNHEPRESRSDGHLSVEQLLQAADGELSFRKAREVRNHLEACWACRSRQEQVERAVSGIVYYRNRLVAPNMPPPANGRSVFVARLESLAQHSEQYPGTQLISAVRSFLGGRWIAPALGLAAVALLVVLLIPFRPPAVLSAAVVLQKSGDADRALLSQVGRVIHSEFALEYRAGSGSTTRHRIELWRSTSDARQARRVFDDSGHLIAAEWVKANGSRILYDRDKPRQNANGVATAFAPDTMWLLTPSAASFTSLTGSPETLSIEQQADVYVLSYEEPRTIHGARLLNASLKLRRSDLHAVEQTVTLEQHGSVEVYRLTETNLERRPEPEVAAAVFSPDPDLGPRQLVVSAPAAKLATVAASADLEVALLDRLDQVHALVGEQLTLRRTPTGALLLQGLVEDQSRRAEVEKSLGSLAHDPAVAVRIETVGEAAEREQRSMPSRIQMQELEPGDARIAIYRELESYLVRERHLQGADLESGIRHLADDIASHSAQAWLHALAVQDIAARFSSADLQSMSSSARSKWTALLACHARAFDQETERVASLLRPVASPSPIPMQRYEISSDTELLEGAKRLAELAAVLDHSVRASVSLYSQRPKEPLVNTNAYWTSLQEARSLSAAILERSGSR